MIQTRFGYCNELLLNHSEIAIAMDYLMNDFMNGRTHFLFHAIHTDNRSRKSASFKRNTFLEILENFTLDLMACNPTCEFRDYADLINSNELLLSAHLIRPQCSHIFTRSI